MYGLAAGDPVNFGDPFGLSCEGLWKDELAAVADSQHLGEQGPSCAQASLQLAANVALDASGAVLAKDAARIAKELHGLEVNAKWLSKAGRYLGDGESYWAGVRGARADLAEARAASGVASGASGGAKVLGAVQRGSELLNLFRTVTEFLPWGGSVWAVIDWVGACL